ncbi:MAG: tol-pal system YbgF family protein [Novosphingobium sp.]
MVKDNLRFVIAAVALAGTGLVAVPQIAHAQVDDARMRKIEAEVRALQRKVFPGGDGRFFESQPATGATPASTGLPPATTPVTDMLARVDSIESQLRQLTAQVETNTNALARLSAEIERFHPEVTQLRAAAVVAPPVPADSSPQAVPVSASSAAMTSGAVSTAAPAPAPLPARAPTTTAAAVTPTKVAAAAPVAGPSAERLARVQAITKPATGDAGDDEYSYGFRLWDAGLYPEAQQQLRMMVEKYPSHSRISYARNLLGRAYLDDGKPNEAAPWFLKNYQADKEGARAGDSLLFLAEAMIAAKDTSRACIALAEFGETYPALATGRLQSQYESDRRKVTCK